MKRYGKAAIKAVELCLTEKLSPNNAWKEATAETFPNSQSSQAKSCPRNVFLGLCEDGHVNKFFYTKI